MMFGRFVLLYNASKIQPHHMAAEVSKQDGKDAPADTAFYERAALNGHLEVLQWARDNQCLWTEWPCAIAAQNGHLEVLQWARDNQCLWTEWPRAIAAANRQG